MTKPLTHRERAERAAGESDELYSDAWGSIYGPSDSSIRTARERSADAIARDTFPRELVKAARKMQRQFCDSHEFCMDDPDGTLPRSHHPDCTDVRDAIALYEEETDHE